MTWLHPISHILLFDYRSKAPQEFPMEEWAFFGKIYPLECRVGMSMSIALDRAEYGHCTAQIISNNGYVLVRVQIQGTCRVFHHLLGVAQGIAETQLDYLAFAGGLILSLRLESAMSLYGNIFVRVGPQEPILAEKRLSRPMCMEPPTSLMPTGALQVALSDFKMAMHHPVQAGFYCYRAVESAMQEVAGSSTKKGSQAWKLFRDCLRVSEGAAFALKAYADAPRHGHSPEISHFGRNAAISLTDEILQRFVFWLENGRHPLDPQHFPELLWVPPD